MRHKCKVLAQAQWIGWNEAMVLQAENNSQNREHCLSA